MPSNAASLESLTSASSAAKHAVSSESHSVGAASTKTWLTININVNKICFIISYLK